MSIISKKLKKKTITKNRKESKISIGLFEKTYSNYNFNLLIENLDNTPGNYYNYVSKILKFTKIFDNIDYEPEIAKKTSNFTTINKTKNFSFGHG